MKLKLKEDKYSVYVTFDKIIILILMFAGIGYVIAEIIYGSILSIPLFSAIYISLFLLMRLEREKGEFDGFFSYLLGGVCYGIFTFSMVYLMTMNLQLSSIIGVIFTVLALPLKTFFLTGFFLTYWVLKYIIGFVFFKDSFESLLTEPLMLIFVPNFAIHYILDWKLIFPVLGGVIWHIYMNNKMVKREKLSERRYSRRNYMEDSAEEMERKSLGV